MAITNPTIWQVAGYTSFTAPNTMNFKFAQGGGAATTAGNLLLALINWQPLWEPGNGDVPPSPGGLSVSISTPGVTWTFLGSVQGASFYNNGSGEIGGTMTAVYYCQNAPSVAASTLTSVSFYGGSWNFDLGISGAYAQVMEIGAYSVNNVALQYAGNTGNNSSMSGGSISSSVNPSMLVSYVSGCQNGGAAPSSPVMSPSWTNLVNSVSAVDVNTGSFSWTYSPSTYAHVWTASGIGVSGNPAPTITGLSAVSGPISGGTAVTITGTGFMTTSSPNFTTVTFGGVAATNVVVVSSTQITCNTPAHVAGAVTVSANNFFEQVAFGITEPMGSGTYSSFVYGGSGYSFGDFFGA